MTLDNAILDILFRRINPEEILAEYRINKPKTLPQLCVTKAESVLGGYSYEEKEGVIGSYLPAGDDGIRLWEDTPRQLGLVAELADAMLVPGERCPACRYGSVMDWREIYLLLGQDLLTTSWLARKSLSVPVTQWFSWPAILPVDNPILNRITDGIAENHMHLMAGASTFAITWCCLMNHPDAIFDAEGLNIRLQPFATRETLEIWNIERRVLYAAHLRLSLFKRICGELESAVPAFDRFHARYTLDEWECPALTRDVADARRVHGLPFPQPESLDGVSLDYAFTAALADQREEHSRLLASERQLMYQCFRMCYEGRLNTREQWLFYLYLLLKSQFRSELVQVNNQVGFHNFHDYDDRKAMMWKKRYPEYLNEDYRQTVNANLKEQRLSSLEGRLSPAKSAAEDIGRVDAIDYAFRFYDKPDAEARAYLARKRQTPTMENPLKEARHFYVLHFPKEKDKQLRRSSKAAPVCRHQAFREELRKKAIELASALSNNVYFAERIRGIDACSFEIVCRPEVFGTAFRFLRSFPVQHYRRIPYAATAPRLGVTYHVGEDFLDIADGLRAVDEALRFLGMERGDRLGHATVLGVDPKTHYSRKNRQVIMSKQEVLDTCVWLLYRSSELGVEIPMVLRQEMRQKAYGLFSELYRDKTSVQGTTLEDYYWSMALRGDDPRCYKSGHFQFPRITDGFDMYCVRNGIRELRLLRKQERIAELCFLYHYCHGVLNQGSKQITAYVDDEYTFLMKKMQEAMREYVNEKGVSIESNPSSNVLIGTFGSYQKHPILTFYNRGLGIEKNGVQMHVSVNTDDPGVFDTSLSFEYALISKALQEMKDDSGKRINSDRAIEDYIRDLVRMGREQCFPKVIT